MNTRKTLHIAVIAGEHSGDALGASVIRALRAAGIDVHVTGVGDEKLAAAGQRSYFLQSDIAVMGVTAVLQRLPLLLRRINETASRIVADNPDILLTIDSPDFNFKVAKKVRARAPHIPIVHWVCPSVWAWRPWRARKMRAFIDHVLCLLPFEPDALRRLNGPAGTYAGHPLIERVQELRPQTQEELAARAAVDQPEILILPGSRRSIATRLLPLFADVVANIHRKMPDAKFFVPTVPAVRPLVAAQFQHLNLPVIILDKESEKLAAMRRARAALAASGTVTLELALAQIPTVAAYKVAEWEAIIARRVIRVSSVLLPNLVLEHNAVPEFLQENCTVQNLEAALLPLIAQTPARDAQLMSFAKLDDKMSLGDTLPSAAAARVILQIVDEKSGQ